MHAKVIFIDDEPNVLEGLKQSLRRTDYTVLTAQGPDEALALLQREPVDVVVCDYLMPGMSGLELLGLIRDRMPDAMRIVLTGHADTAAAVRAINEGEIYRFLVKPCDRTELLVTLHLACERLAVERENRLLLSLVRTRPELMAQFEEARAAHDRARRATEADAARKGSG